MRMSLKSLVISGLLFSSSGLLASERQIQDLMYLPDSGTIYGSTDSIVTAINIYKKKEKSDFNGFQLRQLLGYSLAKYLSLSVSGNWTKARSETPNDPAVRIQGLSDPTFSARWRMYEQKINIDLLSDFLVSTGELETNGDATRVNNKAGATGVGVGLQIGSKVNDFQWSILGRFSRTFEGETNYAGFKVIYGAHSAGNVEGSTLFLLTNKTYFKTTLAVAIADRYQIAKSVTSASSTTETLGGELQQLWSPNLLFRGGMSVGNTTTNGVQQFTTWIFNLGMKYQY